MPGPRASLFRSPPRLPLIAPSILSARFTHMAEDCAGVLGTGAAAPTDPTHRADLLHLDVMDGHFVPNLTMGPDMCRSLREEFPEAFLDVHLMVTDPDRFVDPFIKAGADHLTFHVEVRQGGAARRLVDRIRTAGATAGLAINPPTPAEAILPLVPHADLMLVMSVHPGFSGQSFIPGVLDTVRAVRARLRPDQRLQMDGGIGPEQVPRVREAGCDVIVAASAIFGLPAPQRGARIAQLRSGQ